MDMSEDGLLSKLSSGSRVAAGLLGLTMGSVEHVGAASASAAPEPSAAPEQSPSFAVGAADEAAQQLRPEKRARRSSTRPTSKPVAAREFVDISARTVHLGRKRKVSP